ncbi:MAG: SDR family oxidoreductase [Blastochloris sp.]|nr:SDR family oxidoreductase [Blastochloris sp.]
MNNNHTNTHFQDARIVITGCAGELGRVLCETFTAAGAQVAGLTFQKPAPSSVKISASLDFQKPETIGPALLYVQQQLGSIDILINNIGHTHDAHLSSLSALDLQKIINVNLLGTMEVCRIALPSMISQRHGNILNISSLAASRPQSGQAAYAAAKGGIESFTKALARENAARNIRVNAIAPGFLGSSIIRSLPLPQQQELLGKIPLARWGDMSEVAALAYFLSSDSAAYITGQVISIDGGASM